MTAILFDKLSVKDWVNATVISLDEAPEAYKLFDEGVNKKFVIDPHGMLPISKRGLGGKMEGRMEETTKSKESTTIA